MNKTEDLAKEVIEHSDQATELFKTSDELYKAGMEGLIDKGIAANAISELNNEGLAEAEQAIELQKEFFTEQEKE